LPGKYVQERYFADGEAPERSARRLSWLSIKRRTGLLGGKIMFTRYPKAAGVQIKANPIILGFMVYKGHGLKR